MRGSELERQQTCALVFSKMKLSFRAELAHFAKPSSSRVCWREAPFLCCIRVRQFLKLPRWTTTERTASSYERYLTRNTPCRTESLMPWFFIISSKFFLIPNYLFHFQTRVERSTVHGTYVAFKYSFRSYFFEIPFL